MLTTYLSCLTAASILSLGAGMPTTRATASGLRTVHQFPNGTWIENMAVRSNGQILGDDINGGRIFLVDPANPQPSPPVLMEFKNQTLPAGIVEVEHDVFYTQTIQGIATKFQFVANSSAIWKVDMRDYDKTHKAVVTKVTNVPAAGLLNGMVLLSQADHTLLSADSVGGVVYRINVLTGASEVVVSDPLLAPVAGDSPSFGVNGIRIHGGDLYFSNTNRGLLAKVPIGTDGKPTGPVVNISTAVPNIDDFAVDASSTVWACRNIDNTLVRISPNGTVNIVAGGSNSTALIGPVSARFGRGSHEKDILYVSTDGLQFDSVGNPITSDGKIAMINVKTL